MSRSHTQHSSGLPAQPFSCKALSGKLSADNRKSMWLLFGLGVRRQRFPDKPEGPRLKSSVCHNSIKKMLSNHPVTSGLHQPPPPPPSPHPTTPSFITICTLRFIMFVLRLHQTRRSFSKPLGRRGQDVMECQYEELGLH